MQIQDNISAFLKIGFSLFLLCVLTPLLAANEYGSTTALECARKDTLGVHPVSNLDEVADFIALIDSSRALGLGLEIQKDALERAFNAASTLDFRKERVELANELMAYYYYTGLDLTEQVSFATIVADDLEKLPLLKQSVALNMIGNITFTSGDHSSAITFYRRAYETADSSRPVDKIYSLGNLSETYLINHDTTAAIQTIHQSLELAKSLDVLEETAYNSVYDYTLLGNIFLARGIQDSAHTYLALAAENSLFFTPSHRRFKEMQITLLPALIRLQVAEKNISLSLANIDSLEVFWPELSTLLLAEHHETTGNLAKALELTNTQIKTDLTLDKQRIELRKKLAASLGQYDVANAATSQLLAISEQNLARNKTELVAISKAQMKASEEKRLADNLRYESHLEQLQSYQRSWIAIALTFLSLTIAIWFNQRYKKSQQRSLNLSKIVSQHEKDLIAANEQLASKVKSMERFNHLVSHDLREPLRSISGFTSILKRKIKPYQELTEDFELLSGSVDQLAYLMTGVEELRRVEEKNLAISKVNLNEIFDRIQSNINAKYPDHTINITINGELTSVFLDDELFYKSTLEVLDNSVKFCKAKIANVSVELLNKKDALVINIHDEGIGMNTDFAEQIFGVFKRLNRRENFVGSGVGLALVKLATEKCNGSVTLLESQLDIGSTFQLTFPLSRAAVRQRAEADFHV